jgi:uracil-DNA glycosylase family 4
LWREREPSWFNAPVPAFLPPEGEDAVRLLIIGLAPGLRGANRTGRPFTGDYAGDLLYSTLISHGFAQGKFEARIDDSLELIGTAIVNAVRCVPPENKPVGAEISTCRTFLIPTIARFKNLQAVLTLGTIAHQSTVRALGGRVAAHPFRHGGQSRIGDLTLFSSYHCSRYNTNTGVLTTEMFVNVFREIEAFLDQ